LSQEINFFSKILGIPDICIFFSLTVVVDKFLAIFHKIKVSKYIWALAATWQQKLAADLSGERES
jgi:hypothetical protein